nr:hypothetical protein [Tanacetum cinerariifolium]
MVNAADFELDRGITNLFRSVVTDLAVFGVPGAKTRVHTPAPGGSEAQNGLSGSILSNMRRETSDMHAELLALREQPRRSRQPGEDARVLDHQDAPRDADSHI